MSSSCATGSDAPRQLYCMEHYTLDLQGGKYFEQDPNSLLLHAGATAGAERAAPLSSLGSSLGLRSL